MATPTGKTSNPFWKWLRKLSKLLKVHESLSEMAEVGRSHEGHLLHLAAFRYQVLSGSLAISLVSEIWRSTLDDFRTLLLDSTPC